MGRERPILVLSSGPPEGRVRGQQGEIMWVGEEEENGAGSPGSRIPIWSTKSGKHRGLGFGFSLPSKHRKKEPLKGQHLIDPGAWQEGPLLGRAWGSY